VTNIETFYDFGNLTFFIFSLAILAALRELIVTAISGADFQLGRQRTFNLSIQLIVAESHKHRCL
jgi:hypothetical protein